MLVAEAVRLSFRDAGNRRFLALDLPAFIAAAGGLTVVRGASGSGKSTLLHVLGGLQPPESGSVRLDGVDIYALREAERDAWRRERIGFVFQDFHLLPELSPVANVAVAATFARSQRDLAGRARALLARLGVPHERRSIDEMSRGERQRVAIARALLFDPQVVIADEPTASLDDEAGEMVFGVLRDVAQGGRTVVVASHDATAAIAADKIVTLEHGRAVERRKAAA